jgi:hypothetical protein
LFYKFTYPSPYPSPTRGEGKSPPERGRGVCSPPLAGGVGEGENLSPFLNDVAKGMNIINQELNRVTPKEQTTFLKKDERKGIV